MIQFYVEGYLCAIYNYTPWKNLKSHFITLPFSKFLIKDCVTVVVNHYKMKWQILLSFLLVIAWFKYCECEDSHEDYNNYHYDYDYGEEKEEDSEESLKCSKCYHQDYISKYDAPTCRTSTESLPENHEKIIVSEVNKPCCAPGEFAYQCKNQGNCKENYYNWYCGTDDTFIEKNISITCPDYCTFITDSPYNLTDLDSNGALKPKNDDTRISDFCIASQCPGDPNAGPYVIPVCLCPTDQAFEKAKKRDYESIPRCCDGDRTIAKWPSEIKPIPLIKCVSSTHHSSNSCEHDHYKEIKEVGFEVIDDSTVGLKKYQNNDYSSKVLVTTPIDDVCLATILPRYKSDAADSFLNSVVLYCPPLKETSLRLCNTPNNFIDYSKILLDNFHVDISTGNMAKVPHKEQDSRNKGDKKLETLKLTKCNGRFNLKLDPKTSVPTLIRESNGKSYKSSEFCLKFTDDESVEAEVLKEGMKTDFAYYDLLLWISAVMVLIILFIHYVYKKKLVYHAEDQSALQRMKRQEKEKKKRPTNLLTILAGSVFLLYFVKACNQINGLNLDHPKACTFLGLAQQFFIFTTFSLLTTFGAEVTLLIK